MVANAQEKSLLFLDIFQFDELEQSDCKAIQITKIKLRLACPVWKNILSIITFLLQNNCTVKKYGRSQISVAKLHIFLLLLKSQTN